MGQCAPKYTRCCIKQGGAQYDGLDVVTPPRTSASPYATACLDEVHVENQKLRARIKELEAQLATNKVESGDSTDFITIVHDPTGGLDVVIAQDWLGRCGAAREIVEQILRTHLQRMWKRFCAIDGDSVGTIGESEVRDWLHRLSHQDTKESEQDYDVWVAQVLRAASPVWATGERVGFNDWCQLCHRVRSSQPKEVPLVLVQDDDVAQLQAEFDECWGADLGGSVNETRIQEMVESMTTHSTQAACVAEVTQNILQLFGCAIKGSIDLKDYIRLISSLRYQLATLNEREANPLNGSPSLRAAGSPSEDPQEQCALLSDEYSEEQLRDTFGLVSMDTNDIDTATIIVRNVVSVVEARRIESGYTLTKSKNGVSLYMMDDEYVKVRIGETKQKYNSSGIKLETVVDLPAKLLFDIMTDPDLNATGATGSTYSVVNELDKCDAGSLRLAHSRVSIPLVADQDFGLGEFTGYFHDSYVYAFCSVKDKRIPAPKGRCVRGTVHNGGWAFFPEGPCSTRVTFVSFVNPNRSVPKAMVNQGHDRSAKAMLTFIKNSRAYVKKHNVQLQDFYA